MTNVTIISGFLGAGKTTFIKKLLSDVYAGQKVVLIENEFGEIGIDGGFLKDAGIEITEMNSGCICCSLVGDFGKALVEVVGKFSPDRIIIEPSGVGKLSDVIAAVEKVKEQAGLNLENFITVADATKCKMYMKNFGEFYNNQIENASTIILSRTQNMSDDKLEASVKLIQDKNNKAAIITTPWDELSSEQIESALNSKSLAEEILKDMDVCPECGHHHDHDEECDHDHEHEHHHDHDHDHDECDHDHHEHEHHHDHDDECGCGHEHHHDHDHDECGCGHDHHHHHADEIFTSWGKETPHKYDKSEIEEILHKLVETEEYGVILRAKGMVPSNDGTWIYFDAVPGEYEVRKGEPDYTGRLCVIGTKLDEDKMQSLFKLN